MLRGEWIARGALTADTVTSFIFPHAEAYLLAWLFLFLVWLLLDWIFRLPPLSTLGMAVLGCVPCAVNFYTLQLRGEPFLPWDLAQVSEAAGVASAAGIKIQTSMIVTVVVELALMAGSFFLYRGRHKQRWLPRVAGSAATAAALCLLIFGVYLQPAVCQAVGIVADPFLLLQMVIPALLAENLLLLINVRVKNRIQINVHQILEILVITAGYRITGLTQSNRSTPRATASMILPGVPTPITISSLSTPFWIK